MKPHGRSRDDDALDDGGHQRALRRRAADPIRSAPRPSCAWPMQREADHGHRDEHADDESDLLVERRRADDDSRSSDPATWRRHWPRRCRRSRRPTAPRPARPPAAPDRSAQPASTKMRHVPSSVAIVMPEIGFDEEPISPTMREDTATKKKPKTTMRTLTRSDHGKPTGIACTNGIISASTTEPIATQVIGMSRSVRSCAAAARAAAQLAHRIADRRVDGRQRAQQRQQPRHRHGAGADVADVGAIDPVRLAVAVDPGLREAELHQVGLDRLLGHEHGEQRDQREPRQHAARHHDAGDARADDVADAEVLAA